MLPRPGYLHPRGWGGGQAAQRQLYPRGASCPRWGARYPGLSTPGATCPKAASHPGVGGEGVGGGGGGKLSRVQEKPVHRYIGCFNVTVVVGYIGQSNILSSV